MMFQVICFGFPGVGRILIIAEDNDLDLACDAAVPTGGRVQSTIGSRIARTAFEIGDHRGYGLIIEDFVVH